MLLTITRDPLTGVYTGTFYDGPDGIDDFQFSGNSLGECFEKVIAFQTRNSDSYAEAITPETNVYYNPLGK